MTVKSFFRRARIAGQAFSDLANWREVLPDAASGKAVTEIRLRSGSVLTASPETGLWSHFSDVWYHHSYTKFCSIPLNSLVVDIGANVGVFSLFAARFARLVYAVEPASSNYSRLVQNASQVQAIVPLNYACAACDGIRSLDVSGIPVTFSLMTGSTGTAQESVEVVSLATLFERYRIDSCDYLKLDCEGAEFEIILEADPSILNRVRRIVLEYHDHLSSKYSHLDILEKLGTLGFHTSTYNSNGTYGMIAAGRS
jgi:FkbM family methyltransferase